MKRFCYLILSAFVLLAGIAYWLSVSQAQSPEPRSILEKAIEAHGGAENIGKPRMGILKGISKGDGPEISQEETFDLPKRWKRVTSATLDGKRRVSFDLMVDGKLWQWDDGIEPQETPNTANAQPYFAIVSLLLHLTKEKVKLTRLQKTKVNGDSAAGFRATWDSSTAADYYFDAKTGLLVQSRFTFQSQAGKDLATKTVYTDYKDDDGVMLARRRTTYVKGGEFKDYVLLTDYLVTEVRILNTIANDVFSLPGKK